MGKRVKSTVDDWVKANSLSSKRCLTCRHEKASSRIVELLEAMIRNECPVVRRRIYDRLKEENRDYQVSFFAFGEHLRECIGPLWKKARYGE